MPLAAVDCPRWCGVTRLLLAVSPSAGSL